MGCCVYPIFCDLSRFSLATGCFAIDKVAFSLEFNCALLFSASVMEIAHLTDVYLIDMIPYYTS